MTSLSKLKSDWLLLGAHIYFVLPVFIFVMMWLKLYLALPLAAVMIWSVYRAFRDEEPLWKPPASRDVLVKTGMVLALICLWVLSSGVGASVVQTPDHVVRNELFRLLTEYPWPIRWPDWDGTERGLNYYIGFWLPAALAGKWMGFQAGLVFQQIWSVIGIFFVWRFICEKQKAVRVWFFVVFVLFGGLDAAGRWITGNLYQAEGNSYEWWAIFYNYPGMTSHLFWAYNQAIYGWLLYCLIMRQTNNRSLLFIWSASLLTCTFPAVGMIPFVIYRALQNSEGEQTRDRIKQGLKKCISVGNAAGIVISLILASYLMANFVVLDTLPFVSSQGAYAAETQTPTADENGTLQLTLDEDGNVVTENGDGEARGQEDEGQSGETPAAGIDESQSGETPAAGADESQSASSAGEPFARSEYKAWPQTTRIWMYLWFILLEIGVFFALIYRDHKNQSLYWLCLAVLLICPLIRVGYFLDFCERASIPAFLCLCEMVITSLRKSREGKRYIAAGLLIAVLLAGSITAFDTTRATMANTAATVENLLDEGDDVVPRFVTDQIVMGYGSNFSAEMDTFFYKYLAR